MSDGPDIVIDAAAEAVPLTAEFMDEVDPLKSGFMWYKPPMATSTTGGHEWTISGNDMQILTSTVPAGETVVTEIGSFMYMSPFMETKVELTLCSRAGCGEGWGRIFGGESCVKVLLINDSSEQGYVGITPGFPAKVIPVQFGKHVTSGSGLIAQGGAIMTHLGDVEIGCDLDCSITTCCCAGLGCCRQKITASDDSIAFLAAGGTLVFRHLKDDETITVDSRSVVAMEDTVTLGITPNGRCCTCLFGGEGIFSTTLTGPGRVYMQSYSFQKFRSAVQQTVMEDRGDNGQAAQGFA